jgi:hypothetical protein
MDNNVNKFNSEELISITKKNNRKGILVTSSPNHKKNI